MRVCYYSVYDKNKQFLGCCTCLATQILDEFPEAKFIKTISKPWNYHYFKEIDDEISDELALDT